MLAAEIQRNLIVHSAWGANGGGNPVRLKTTAKLGGLKAHSEVFDRPRFQTTIDQIRAAQLAIMNLHIRLARLKKVSPLPGAEAL
jgi:hypothetical protein